jgi:four helix bundle protein
VVTSTTPRRGPKKPRRFSCAEKLSAVSRQLSARTRRIVQDFRNLVVWQKAHSTVLQIYRLTKRFPDDERFGLTSQLRRSASSIPANLAEGCGRGSDQDFARFVQIAMGSATEVEYHLLLARDLEYIGPDEYAKSTNAIQEVKRMLASLLKTVRN